VISQVEFFANVPVRVNQLRLILDNEPHRIREVFLEAIKLDSLRTALIKEIKVSRNRRSSANQDEIVPYEPPATNAAKSKLTGNNKPSAPVAHGDYSMESGDKVIKVVEQHLKTIPELYKEIKDRLFATVERMSDIAIESPADLVATFEIIEMQSEYATRLRHQREKEEYGDSRGIVKMKEPAGRNARILKPPSSFSESDVMNDLVPVVKGRIKHMFSEKVEMSFELAKTDVSLLTLSPTSRTLTAASQVLRMITEFNHDVIPCTPPHYNIIGDFIEALEEYMDPVLYSTLSQITDLAVADMMQVIDWIESYVSQLAMFDEDGRPFCMKLGRIAEQLLGEYLLRIKSQVLSWFKNIKGLKVEIKENSDGTLITSTPEEMFNVLYHQFDVAKEKLPTEYFKDVLHGMIDSLKSVQSESYDMLVATWMRTEVDTLCAGINDTQRMQDKGDELAETQIILVPQEKEQEKLKYKLDELSNRYISIAVDSVAFLSRRVLAELEEAVFCRLFVQEWESGEPLSVIVVATLSDYLKDIQIWLGEYFFCKFVRDLFTKVVNLYITAICRRPPGSWKFRNELRAAHAILADRDKFIEYFETLADVLHRGGLRPLAANGTAKSAVTEELSALHSFARIISTPHINACEAQLKELFTRLGIYGLKVAVALIQSSPAWSKNEKTDNVDYATKLFDKGGKSYSKTIQEIYSFVVDRSDDDTGNKKADNTKKGWFY